MLFYSFYSLKLQDDNKRKNFIRPWMSGFAKNKDMNEKKFYHIRFINYSKLNQ